MGQALAVGLTASPDVKKVMAIDAHQGDIAGVTWHVTYAGPGAGQGAAEVDVVVPPPMTSMRLRRQVAPGPWTSKQTVLAAAAGRVGRMMLLTSAMVSGDRPDDAVPGGRAAHRGCRGVGPAAGDRAARPPLAASRTR